jgi:Spy/CpxP family protein refolding chaperone
MKKITIVLALSFSTVISFAQVQRNAPLPGDNNYKPDSTTLTPTQKPGLKEQMEALNLSKDQKIQIRDIRQNSKTAKEDIMANDSLTTDQKQMKLKELHKQTAKSIDAILTDDQRVKMQAIREQMKNNSMGQQQNGAMQEEIMTLPAN